MRLRRLQPPSELPVSLDELKEHVRVDHNEEDATLSLYLAAAVEQLDGWSGMLGRALMEQSWAAELDYLPASGEIELPLPPLQSVDAVWITNAAGEAEQLDLAAYEVRLAAGAVLVRNRPRIARGPITVEFTAGAGTPAAVPANVRAAILLVAADLYANREAQGPVQQVNPTLQRLLAPLTVPRV